MKDESVIMITILFLIGIMSALLIIGMISFASDYFSKRECAIKCFPRNVTTYNSEACFCDEFSKGIKR